MGNETESLLVKVEKEEVDLFENWVCQEWRNCMPTHLSKIRNKAIYMIFFEIVSCVL